MADLAQLAEHERLDQFLKGREHAIAEDTRWDARQRLSDVQRCDCCACAELLRISEALVRQNETRIPISVLKEIALQGDVVLTPTDHPRLKFMSPTGCVVPPHLRPLCTLHTCDVNGRGFKPNDPAWTARYFALREQLEESA